MSRSAGRGARLALGVTMTMLACGEPPPDVAPGAPSPDPVAETPSLDADVGPPRLERRFGVRFDPAEARPGDTIGTLVLDSIDARPTVVDSSLVGTARFDGEIELSGATLAHFDEDLRPVSVCFEADDESAARLPRWERDERRAWFCFGNAEQAAAELARPGEVVSATVVIDDFTIHRGLSDEVNSARFVRRAR